MRVRVGSASVCFLTCGGESPTVQAVFLLAAAASASAPDKCNVRTISVADVTQDELASVLASSAEPVLVEGFAGVWACGSIDTCAERYGEMALSISTGAAIGANNPEAARSFGMLSLRQFVAELKGQSSGGEAGSRHLPTEDAYTFQKAHGTLLEKDFSPLRKLFSSVLAASVPLSLSLSLSLSHTHTHTLWVCLLCPPSRSLPLSLFVVIFRKRQRKWCCLFMLTGTRAAGATMLCVQRPRTRHRLACSLRRCRRW